MQRERTPQALSSKGGYANRPRHYLRPLLPLVEASRLLLLALPPAEVELLSKGDGGIIIGDLSAGRAVGAREGDAVVDVEDAVGAARGPDVAGRGDLVVLGVDLALGPDTATLDRGLRGRGGLSVLAEVVGAVEGSSDTGLELSIAVVGAIDEGKLETAGIPEAQVKLAVPGLERRADTGSDVGLERIEAEGDDSLVGRDVGRHTLLRAATAGPLRIGDLDLLRVGLISPSLGGQRAGSDERREQEGDGTHFDGMSKRLLTKTEDGEEGGEMLETVG